MPDYEMVAHISQYITRAFGIDSDDMKEREMLREVTDSSMTQAGEKLRAWYHDDKDANNPWLLHTKFSQDVQILSVLPIPNSPNAYEVHFLTKRYSNADYRQVDTQAWRATLITKSGKPKGSNLFGVYFDSLTFAKEGE
jgi:VirB8 protein